MDGQTRLAQAQQPWKKAFLDRAERLSPDLAELVRNLVHHERDHQQRAEDMKVLADVLRGDAVMRQALAEVFFPHFPGTVQRTLEAILTRHPYPQGHQRRSFRAPGHRLHADRAANWLWATWFATRDYPQDLEWFAVHAGLLGSWQAHGLGLLFAQALDDGDEAVFQILRDTAGTQHPVARMGRHVPQALLASGRPEAWDLAEGLLLAAQRQEGLRQVILETVDEAHPGAFTRFLRLILREDLLRFAACFRAADVWFGLGYDVTDVKAVRKLLEQALGYLEESSVAHSAVTGGSGVDAYLALFTLAMRDAEGAATFARTLLTDADPERRMAAVQFLHAAEMLGQNDLPVLIMDPDVRIGALAASRVNRWQPQAEPCGLSFEELTGYAARLGAEAAHQPLLFPWLGQVPARADILDTLPALLGERPFAALTSHLGGMSSWGKTLALRLLQEHQAKTPLDAPTRDLLMTLLQDRNPGVAEEAVRVAAKLTLAPGETEIVLGLLRRRSADLRRGLIRLLARDPQAAALSAARLLATRNTEQRQAGLQLLLETGGTTPESFRPSNTTEETLYARLTQPQDTLTLENGLGLFDPQALAPLPTLHPCEHDYAREVRRGTELLKSLDELIHAHREDPLTGSGWDGETTVLLGNVSPWMLRREEMPLADLWQRWWQSRPGGKPGDLTRMTWALHHFVARRTMLTEEVDEELGDGDGTPGKPHEAKQQLRWQTLHRLFGPLVPLWLEYAPLVREVVAFLAREAEPADTDLALDVWETGLTYLPQDAEMIFDPRSSWSRTDPRDLLAHLHPITPAEQWTPEQLRRVWSLSVYADRAFERLPRSRPDVGLLIGAETRGWATRQDLVDALIGPRANEGTYYRQSFTELATYTTRKLREELPTSSAWLAAVDEVRNRILDVELARGDLETPATRAALSLQSLQGAHRTLRLLAGIGKNPLRRGYVGQSESRDATYSHLIRVSFPAPDDTPATFAREVKAFGLQAPRLLDLAMFAPQWVPLVADTLGWKGLQDGVYWLHAHTKDNSWSVPQEVRAAWEAEISERTPLGAQALTEGAVDVAWFRRMYKALGAKQFADLLDAAKYASSSGGHKRAELFARALLGEVQVSEVQARITEKRNQDAVRALGLLPLSRGKTKGAKELEGRYRLLSEFRKKARQFGAQRQASERLAADIGMQNLARTAGYDDPQRLTWAMEARLAPDWQQEAEVDGVTVGIDLTPEGGASLRIRRGEKALKNLPPTVKKHPEVIRLREAVNELSATRGRMRTALEDAMIRGDHFRLQELEDLALHPVIAPMLRALVWVMNEQRLGWWQGDHLQTLDGALPVGEQALRLAHPHDLFADGRWPAFQEQVMAQGITQPFKQVFREYYPLTPGEKDALRSTRYDGHQVGPTQAAALFKARGWVAVPEEGVRKTYHAENISVWVDSSIGYFTPNEVEGTPLRAVYFVRRDETQPMVLGTVPPRLFSETMRDLDLVVSVAHVGGVDPEASQSTVEMRLALLRETLRLLGLKNVRLENGHALIAGHHARYTVHLGSGIVHRQPGGYLCIIPVHNAHQGHLFLPFADPDLRTAEVVSKVLLLAEDRKIQDPTILEQLT